MARAIGLSDGSVLEEFEIPHTREGFGDFFSRIEAQARSHGFPVAVAMEGYNGHARPLDALVRARDWRLFNVNNLKLARFKEIFPAAAKNDRLDARKTLELFQLEGHLAMAGGVLRGSPGDTRGEPDTQAPDPAPAASGQRTGAGAERASQADLRAVCPGLLEITGEAGNLWFLRLLTARRGLEKLARLRRPTLLKIPGVGVKYAAAIGAWQKRAHFSGDVAWVGDMIQEDAARILELNRQIKTLDGEIERISSDIARCLRSLPGFGRVCTAELAGEIGTILRFRVEGSLSLYLGMANLDRSSGTVRGSKAPKHVNTRAKAAMMTAVDRHRKQVPQSQRYYEKKRAEGKTHNQAIRALGRHLCRVIFKMLTMNRPYWIAK
ncbi:MAG: transposase [Alphaproteobacteria bacterium]